MEDVIEWRDFSLGIRKEEVFRLMECKEENPVYEEINEEYDRLKCRLYQCASPRALIGLGEIPREYAKDRLPNPARAFFVLVTVGEKLGNYSGSLFAEGEYIKGMLADAIALAMLFEIEEELRPRIRELCKKEHVGVQGRLEAPGDFSMQMQKYIVDALGAKEKAGIRLTRGYMLEPVKTMAYALLLSEDESEFRTRQECRDCKAVDCAMRKKITIRVKFPGGNYEIFCTKGSSIADVLKEKGHFLSMVCGGKGTCGKCRIRLLEGSLRIRPEDERLFTRQELEKGLRLACLAVPEDDITISLNGQEEENFAAISWFQKAEKPDQGIKQETSYGIAIDIGSTTIACALMGLESKKQVAACTGINHQRAFGADILSRIQASVEGRGEALKESIQKDLCQAIRSLLSQAGICGRRVQQVIISANTTMGHLLLGYPCDTLGKAPFLPFYINTVEEPAAKMLSCKELSCKAVLFPGISAFVGGDIVSGLYALGFGQLQSPALFLDLGTNGEMALFNGEKLLTASVAAGPAFEGGNITWGTGSVFGAVCGVKIRQGKVEIKTIGNGKPVGICGTGVIETAAELVSNGYVDETGLLEEAYFSEGFVLAETESGENIVFTQKDIREIQLAKSAVRAGIETLLKLGNISCKEIENVYLAGGFGFFMEPRKAVEIGLFPKELLPKIQAVGNSSLEGAIQSLTDPEAEEKIRSIIEAAEEVALAENKMFQEFYLESMFFNQE